MSKGKWLSDAELQLVISALWIASKCDTSTEEEHKEALAFEALRNKLLRGRKLKEE